MGCVILSKLSLKPPSFLSLEPEKNNFPLKHKKKDVVALKKKLINFFLLKLIFFFYPLCRSWISNKKIIKKKNNLNIPL